MSLFTTKPVTERVFHEHSGKDDVVNFITEEINKGVYKPGDKIPSMKTMTEKFGVTHHQVNMAVREMINKGILGTYKANPSKGTIVLRKETEEIEMAKETTKAKEQSTNEIKKRVTEYRIISSIQNVRISVVPQENGNVDVYVDQAS